MKRAIILFLCLFLCFPAFAIKMSKSNKKISYTEIQHKLPTKRIVKNKPKQAQVVDCGQVNVYWVEKVKKARAKRHRKNDKR